MKRTKEGVGPPFEINAGRLVLHLLGLTSQTSCTPWMSKLHCGKNAPLNLQPLLAEEASINDANNLNLKSHDPNAAFPNPQMTSLISDNFVSTTQQIPMYIVYQSW